VPDVRVDREHCIGSGVCLLYAPNTFDHDGESKVMLRAESTDPPEDIDAAIEGCPTGALHLSSDDQEP
jgi:ferredoxin